MPVKGEGERQPQSALGLLKQMDIHKKENTWCRNGRRSLCRALAAQRPQLCGARLGTPGEKFGTLNLAWLHGKRTSVLICSATSLKIRISLGVVPCGHCNASYFSWASAPAGPNGTAIEMLHKRINPFNPQVWAPVLQPWHSTLLLDIQAFGFNCSSIVGCKKI